MGYRSDVKSCVYGDKSEVDSFIVKYQMEKEGKGVFEYFRKEIKCFELDERDRINFDENNSEPIGELTAVISLEGYSWKWYDSYEDIKAWHDFIDKAREFGLNTEFVRTGEEQGDVDTQYEGDGNNYYLSVETAIKSDFGGLLNEREKY